MGNPVSCERFRKLVEKSLAEEGRIFSLSEKEKFFLHKHGCKCADCRKWGEEFTRIPLSREQEDFLYAVYHRERSLPPILYWSFWSLGIAGTLALLSGVFFYLEERMSTELTPGIKVEAFSSPAEYKKSLQLEKRLFEQRKKAKLLQKKKEAGEFLPEKIEYATVSFPLFLFARHQKPETFFKAYLGNCRIYMMEKDPAGKNLLVHVPKKEAKRFSDLRKRLLQKRR